MKKSDKNQIASANELMEALETLEKEKQISRDVLFATIENSILAACKSQYGEADNIRVEINRETGSVKVFADMEIVEEVTNEATEMSIITAQEKFGAKYSVGDVVAVEVTPKNFGRIAAGQAKSTVIQKIREEEKSVLYNEYKDKEDLVVSGVVSRQYGVANLAVNLGKAEGSLPESEQIRSEHFKVGDRIKVYVIEVAPGGKGPKITLSRTHPNLVKRLFEQEVAEVENGTVEIMALSRDPGARTKIAVRSNVEGVDPIGSCVGPNGMRVNAVVDALGGEKIDIVQWSDKPEILIKNSLSPAKAVYVSVDVENKSAKVIVPDSQLSLAIGLKGQNARLAARLTGYKIDIKSESQAEDATEVADTEE